MKRGLLQVLVANIINLILNLVTGFILPKYLSVPDYGIVKTYQLYISYIGFLHLGYIDGVYLLYGGKGFEEIDKIKYKQQLFTFKIFQLIMGILTLGIAVLLKDITLCIFALSIYPYNLAMYYKFIYQAVGKFNKYSRIINITTLLIATSFIILMLCKISKGITFVWTYLICYLVVAIFFDLIESKNTREFRINIIDLQDSIALIKSGFLLMLGNFSALILTGMDRWCIKFFMTKDNAFSYYSFAVSMQAMIEAVVNPITIVFYNYLCNEKNIERINRIKRYCVLLGMSLMIIAFPCKFIIKYFLTAYVPSIEVLFVLFAAELLYVLIRGIYINLYKAKKMQNLYFKKLVIIIVVALVLNIVFYFFMRRMESFAYATYISTFVWLLLCNNDFKNVGLKRDEWLVIISSTILLFVLEHMNSIVISFIIYLIFMSLLFGLVFRRECRELIEEAKKKIIKV